MVWSASAFAETPTEFKVGLDYNRKVGTTATSAALVGCWWVVGGVVGGVVVEMVVGVVVGW